LPPDPPVSSFVGTDTSSTVVAEPKKLLMVVKASILDWEDVFRTRREVFRVLYGEEVAEEPEEESV